LNTHYTVKEMFHLEVSPALGCSKPATINFATTAAVTGVDIEKMTALAKE
jgi:L-cysteine desulfidase